MRTVTRSPRRTPNTGACSSTSRCSCRKTAVPSAPSTFSSRAGKATPEDFSRLISLLYPTQPEMRARLAELGYDKFKTTDYLVAALGIYSDRRDFVTMRRVFAKMTPEVEAELARSPEFPALRADYRAGTGSPELAYADYREALSIDPRNSSIRIAFLFFLIDRRDIPRLRQEMAAAPEIHKDPTYDGVLGAAWLTLNEPARAIEHFKRAARAQSRRLPVAAQLRRRARAEQRKRHGVARAPACVDAGARRAAASATSPVARAPASAGASRDAVRAGRRRRGGHA